ncbi:MAG: hypothetical protein JWR19_2022 [Pedosphaera sp.]|nr:hypothetical protein [Pedosphaera sp.]
MRISYPHPCNWRRQIAIEGNLINLPIQLYSTARSVHPEPTLGDVCARVKYCVRGLITPRLTSEWFALLNSPDLAPVVTQHPHILSKLQRPYLHRRLTPRGRLTVLKHHYDFVKKHLSENIRKAAFTKPGFLLANLPVPEPCRFSLRLAYNGDYEKEGDLSLCLTDETNGLPLFMLTFCASRFAAGEPRELFIGGLQGRRAPNQHELIITLTRSLHGLRPKALLIFALQRLAQLWGISSLRAVGGDEHIYRHIRKRKDFEANYDEFWRECHGEQLPDGNFQLPVVPLVRNLEELPGNKRGMYRKRYAMLGQLGEEIRRQIIPAQPGTSAVPMMVDPFNLFAFNARVTTPK